jgi:tripartite-type tricarboxylate transporter receptor subunit TctC
VKYVQSGKLKAIAITDTKRNPVLPNVPTTTEEGFPEVQAGIWYGFVAPVATDKAVITKLNAALTQALQDPTVKEKLDGLGLVAIANKPDAFKAQISSESARMKKAVEASGTKLE